MHALSDCDLLELWESGLHRHPVDRALLSLGAAHPQTSYEALADWPLGRRNHAIAEFRGACFGHRIHGWTSCPRCHDRLEFELDWRALVEEDNSSVASQTIVVRERTFRLPTSRDIASIAREADSRRAAIRLVENCMMEPDCRPAWTDDELEEIGDRMAEADPEAETLLTLNCPSCTHAWEENLDLPGFLWEEIEARARRILQEIHTLASAYGWGEAQILALSASRRARYLEMLRA